MDVEYIHLFHQIFSKNIEGHGYRGYTILEEKEVPVRSLEVSLFFYYASPPKRIVEGGDYNLHLNRFPPQLQICLNYQKIVKNVAENFPKTLTDSLKIFSVFFEYYCSNIISKFLNIFLTLFKSFKKFCLSYNFFCEFCENIFYQIVTFRWSLVKK